MQPWRQFYLLRSGKMPEHHAEKIEVNPNFYRELALQDDSLISSLEQAIELYTGMQDKKSSDAALNFEKSLGILTLSYIKMVQAMLKEDWRRLSKKRKLFMNFGIVDSLLMQNNRVLEELIEEFSAKHEEGNYQKYYLNEWLEKVARGAIPLTSDAAQTKSKSQDEEQRERIFNKMKELQKTLDDNCRKEHEGFQSLLSFFKEFKLDSPPIDKIQTLRSIRQQAGELEVTLKEQALRQSELELMNSKLGIEGEDFHSALDSHHADQHRRLRDEFDILVTVMRSCAVRGGLVKNTPVLIDKWIPLDTRVPINTKAFVELKMGELESIDPTVFVEKNGKRITPKILILPGVGTGMAWTDRIIIPLFVPPTVQPEISIIRTLAQYRWYRATSSYKWQDIPGELGSSYQILYPDKILTNLQRAFVDDYEKWMTKEAQGFQVLNSEVRKLFWKHLPFSKELKEKLSNRATIYRQLYAADKAKGK